MHYSWILLGLTVVSLGWGCRSAETSAAPPTTVAYTPAAPQGDTGSVEEAAEPEPAADEEATGSEEGQDVGEEEKPVEKEAAPAPEEKKGDEHPVVELRTGKGTIRLELYPEEAPKTVANFLKLVDMKFYDGTRFHRYVEGFVIQGGDPNSKDDDPSNDGLGGPDWSIPLEIPPTLKHGRGMLGMARSQAPDSAGSQFYICLSDKPNVRNLDGGYCVFGRVLGKGMEVVDQLRKGDRLESARKAE